MAGIGAAPATGGKVMLNVFDGTRNLYKDSTPLLITVRDGNQNTVSRKVHDSSSVEFTGLKIFDNFGDDYTFLASAEHYKDAGFFPVKISNNTVKIVDLMLMPDLGEFNFAPWNAIRTQQPFLADVLAAGADSNTAAEARYNGLKEVKGGAVLACLLNITTAMTQVHLPQRTALHYIKVIRWELDGAFPMAQDRFFAWADPALIEQIEQAKAHKKFSDAPPTLHQGATRSYKQIEFGEANLQFTFHENDRQQIGDINCVLLEPDIDYFKDPLAHLLLEVAVNALGDITDPRTVYALRWIAGRRAGIPEFDPPYAIARTT
jgi:hypothetical protein